MKYRELEQLLSGRSFSAFTASAIDQRGRALRDANLLSHGPRGPYAPDLQLGEVVNVLLGLLAPTAAETAETVTALRAWTIQEGAFPAENFGQALEVILATGPTAAGILEVRIAKTFDMGLIVAKSGVRVRFGSKRPKGSMIYDETVIGKSALSQLWAKLNPPRRKKGGWGKPEAPAGNG